MDEWRGWMSGGSGEVEGVERIDKWREGEGG